MSVFPLIGLSWIAVVKMLVLSFRTCSFSEVTSVDQLPSLEKTKAIIEMVSQFVFTLPDYFAVGSRQDSYESRKYLHTANDSLIVVVVRHHKWLEC